ncbi:MAG: twin-arginine translocation signal domain-containing protein, partial [Planctomycetota bacterium]
MSIHNCTRRNFLKATAFAGGSAAISGCAGLFRQVRGT